MKVYKVTNAEENTGGEIERWIPTDSTKEFPIIRKILRRTISFLVRVPETEQEIIEWFNDQVLNDCLAEGTTIQTVLDEYGCETVQQLFELENFMPLVDEEHIEMEDYWFEPHGWGELVEEEWIGEDEEILEKLRNNTEELPEFILEENGYEYYSTKWRIYSNVDVEDYTEEMGDYYQFS